MTSISATSLGAFSICRSEGPTLPYAGRRCFLSTDPREFWGEPCLALNEPGDQRKDEGYRESTHQYASATFYHPHNSPRQGKKQFSASDRRITASREIQCR